MNLIAYQYFEGIDLMAIEGVSEGLIMALIAEVGLDGIRKFPTAKQFTAWLRLAPQQQNKWWQSIIQPHSEGKFAAENSIQKHGQCHGQPKGGMAR